MLLKTRAPPGSEGSANGDADLRRERRVVHYRGTKGSSCAGFVCLLGPHCLELLCVAMRDTRSMTVLSYARKRAISPRV